MASLGHEAGYMRRFSLFWRAFAGEFDGEERAIFPVPQGVEEGAKRIRDMRKGTAKGLREALQKIPQGALAAKKTGAEGFSFCFFPRNVFQ